MKVDLTSNGAPTLNLSSLHCILHTLHTVRSPHITFTLPQCIEGLIASGVEPTIATTHPILKWIQGSVPLLLKPNPTIVSPTAAFVQHFHPRNLGKTCNLIQHVAPIKLHSCCNGLPTELVYEDREPTHTAVAINIWQISPTLEKPRNWRLPTPSSSLEELGLWGLWEEGSIQGGKGLRVDSSWIW